MGSLALDTHLLMLLVVGGTSRSYIGKHRRLNAYTEADYDLLLGVVRRFASIVVTPHTLTEASNLLGFVQEPMKTEIFRVFRQIIQATEERFTESKQVAGDEEFLRLGLTDTALLEAGSQQITLATGDLQLYLTAARSKYPVLNFTHLRESAGTV